MFNDVLGFRQPNGSEHVVRCWAHLILLLQVRPQLQSPSHGLRVTQTDCRVQGEFALVIIRVVPNAVVVGTILIVIVSGTITAEKLVGYIATLGPKLHAT